MADTMLVERQLALPDEAAVAQAAEALDILGRFLRHHPDIANTSVLLTAGGGSATLQIPGYATRILVDILTGIANGNGVAVAPVHAELTTQQAADLLNVSRPYLVKLLDERRIPYRRVGNRRRILLRDLIDYKNRDEAERRAIADELTADAQRLGLDY